MLCKQYHARKFLLAKARRLPTHEMMHSTYTTKKEPIYIKMTEEKVATVHTTVARTILRIVVL